jgi:hypothetical protein
VSNPILPKIITLTIDGEDFAEDVIGAAVVPVPGAIQTVKTLDGVSHSDAESETWQLELTCVQDWDSVRPGLAWYLLANKGDAKPVIFNVHDAAISATKPGLTFTATMVPIAYGGDGNVYAETSVVLPIDGTPATDITP